MFRCLFNSFFASPLPRESNPPGNNIPAAKIPLLHSSPVIISCPAIKLALSIATSAGVQSAAKLAIVLISFLSCSSLACSNPFLSVGLYIAIFKSEL